MGHALPNPIGGRPTPDSEAAEEAVEEEAEEEEDGEVIDADADDMAEAMGDTKEGAVADRVKRERDTLCIANGRCASRGDTTLGAALPAADPLTLRGAGGGTADFTEAEVEAEEELLPPEAEEDVAAVGVGTAEVGAEEEVAMA